jgi:hypothetical protein
MIAYEKPQINLVKGLNYELLFQIVPGFLKRKQFVVKRWQLHQKLNKPPFPRNTVSFWRLLSTLQL